MNIRLPEKEKIKKRHIILYSSIIFVCIICIIIAFYVQFYARIDISRLIGINSEVKYGNKNEDDIEIIKSEFNQKFNNQIENDEGQNNKKIQEDRRLVYTKYEKKESKLNSYDLEVHIPYINVDSKVVEEYNKEIENIFAQIARNVLQSENRNIVYTVEYNAYIQDGILSVIIKSNLKEGTNAQKVIIKTYNYDLRNNKEITLQEVLKIEHLEEQQVQNRIKEVIKDEQKKVEDLKKLGYTIYNRDLTRDIYTIEKSTEFYLTDEALYIIYAYGNESDTSEMDLVIF